MILTLQVVGERAQDLGAASRKVFKAIGGTIGRLPDNDWVFADPYVSGRHALIRYINGQYFIEDTSTNGVFINSLDNRISKAQAQQLNDGDRLYIDAYEIEVSIKEDPAKRRRDPFADPRIAGKSEAARFSEDHTADLVVDDVDEFDDFDGPEAAHATQSYGAREMRPSSPPVRPALGSVRSSPAASDSRPITRKPVSTSSAPAAAKVSSSATSSADERFEVLLAAAGIEKLDENTEIASVLGTAFLTAMRLAFEAMLARFDPSRLQEDFDRQLKKGSILGVPAKLRYWDLYRERYEEIVKDADVGFRTAFTDEFAKAYQEQLARLKALGRD